MTTYNKLADLKGKRRLHEYDYINFKVGRTTLKYTAYDCNLGNQNGANGAIFAALKISDPDAFCANVYSDKRTYGNNGGFPEYRCDSYDDALAIVRALYNEIEGGSKNMSGGVMKYKAGTSIEKFVKALIGKEKNKERLKWLRTFDNCILPESVKETIDEALSVVLQSDKFDEWGINEHFEKGLTNSILLHGPPGTGKTMVSESIAAILGKNMMKLSTADIQSNVPGKTERNIADAFKQASKDDCVLMLDECDSLLTDRNMVGAIMGSEINALLTELENFTGVVVLTTNRLHRLDPALQRRIIAKVHLPRPDEKARKLIWSKLIPPKMPVKKLDFAKLAKYDLSGGQIKNAILLAARGAIAKAKDHVTMENFEKSANVEIKSQDSFDSTRPKRARNAIPMGGAGMATTGRGKTTEKIITRGKTLNKIFG